MDCSRPSFLSRPAERKESANQKNKDSFLCLKAFILRQSRWLAALRALGGMFRHHITRSWSSFLTVFLVVCNHVTRHSFGGQYNNFFEYDVKMGFSSQRKKCYMATVMARANQEFSLNTASLSPKISTILHANFGLKRIKTLKVVPWLR